MKDNIYNHMNHTLPYHKAEKYSCKSLFPENDNDRSI